MLEFIFLEKHIWLLKVIIAIVLFFFFQLILSHIIKLIKKKSHIEKIDWKKHMKLIFYYPIKILIWIITISYVLSVILDRFGLDQVLRYVHNLRNIALVIDISWLLLKWKEEIQKQVSLKWHKQIDKVTIEFIGKVITIALVFISILIILQMVGLNIMPIVAFGGIGAAGIAFAAKDIIANFFGGLMLYITRPFVKGELVTVPSHKIQGHIESIGWYSTCIRELDKVTVYIPNSIFSAVTIKNNTRRTHRRLEEEICIRYKDFSKVRVILKEIKNMLKEDEKVDPNFTPFVYFHEFSDYSLKIMLKVYCFAKEYKDFLSFKEGILLKIKDILEKNEADIPFPTTSLEFLNEAKK